MIRGIGGRPYVNLDEFIDIEKFKSLHPEIMHGFATARQFAKEGTWMKPGFDTAKGSYQYFWKPIYKAVEEYLALPDDDPIKVGGWDLYTSIKDHHTRNIFTRYLKMAMGAYDPYIYYFLWEEGSWDDRTAPRKLTEEAVHFPNVVQWIESMVGTVFEDVGRVIFFHCEADGIPFEHRDLDAKNGVMDENMYSPHRNKFIHLRANTKKGFYVWDPDAKNKYFLNCHAAWWNDQDWHGGERIMEQSYSLRIDGKFTEDFRKQIGVDHLEYY